MLRNVVLSFYTAMRKAPNLAITESMNYKEIIEKSCKTLVFVAGSKKKILLKRNDIVALINSTEI